MKRSELAHILRSACVITGDPNILVLGSQSILGSFGEEVLPPEATGSIEADVAFMDDPEEVKSDKVDGNIGEVSLFHEEFGVYGQGVSVSTAVLPEGWRGRLVAFDHPEAGESQAFCLDPHDLVISKLVAGREKDFEFARALIEADLVQADTLHARANLLRGVGAIKSRVVSWLDRL
jgi:hypothetical protein